MGGDYAPDVTVLGSIHAYEQLPSNVKLVLIGDKDKIIEISKHFRKHFAVGDLENIH